MRCAKDRRVQDRAGATRPQRYGRCGGSAGATTTLGGLLGGDEARHFVGRASELAAFRRWLGAEEEPRPRLLAVSGPGGVGKTALLGAFRRIAAAEGRTVVAVDGRDLLPTPQALVAALGGGDLDDAVARLGAARALLSIDSFEALAPLARYLANEVLPRLDAAVAVVVAGRLPLARLAGRAPWGTPVRSLPLGGLSAAEAAEYLARRGLGAAVAGRARRAAGGYPLALRLAADVAVARGPADFAPGVAREWPLAVRSMAEALLAEARDPGVRELLEAAAVVRSFDEADLAAVAGRDDVGPAFGVLRRLSVVRATERGLAVAEEVRRILADDLRWRHPGRHEELRARATEHYRTRALAAGPAERERLVAERLYLREDTLDHHLVFGAGAPDGMRVEPGEPGDHDEVVALEAAWRRRAWPARADGAGDGEAHQGLGALLGTEGTRLRVARDANGVAVGFSLVLALWRGSIGVDPVRWTGRVLGDSASVWPQW